MTLIRRTLVASALLAAAAAAHAQANAAAPMLESLGKLHQLHASNYAGAKPADVKAMRQEFRAAVQAAKSRSRAQFEKLAAGKTPDQLDKALRAATESAGAPPDVLRTIDSLGGPVKAMQQAERLIDDFAADVLSSSQQFAVMSPAQHRALALLGVGDAQAGWFKRGACVGAMWVVTVGTSPDSAYKLCDRYS